MTNKDSPQTNGVLGSLRAAGATGIVRIEHRLQASIDDVWSAVSDPERLSSWYGRVDGDLRQGGEFRLYLEADDWEGVGRVLACDPPRHLVVTTRESDESWQKGKGAPPFDSRLDLTLTADADDTLLVVEADGMPVDLLFAYGAGQQIHAEDLAAYVAGRDRADVEARWAEIEPRYRDLAARLGE